MCHLLVKTFGFSAFLIHSPKPTQLAKKKTQLHHNLIFAVWGGDFKRQKNFFGIMTGAVKILVLYLDYPSRILPNPDRRDQNWVSTESHEQKLASPDFVDRGDASVAGKTREKSFHHRRD